MKSSDQSQTTLSAALLIYLVFVVFIITLIPFNFRLPQRIQIAWIANLPDIITNILLFIPIGFLFRLIRRNRKDPFFLLSFAFGVLLSIIIEIAQIFVPTRYTQPMDVVTNGSGAWLGAFLFKILEKKIEGDYEARVFDLELPLMNLMYLFVPLLWLNGLSMGNDSGRLVLVLILGLLGSIVLVSIYTYRFKFKEKLSPNKLSLMALSWFVIGAIPSLFIFPLQVMALALLICVIVQISTRFFKKKNIEERRFEHLTLKRLLPVYVVYLLLLTFWPTTFALSEPGLSSQGLTFDERIVLTFRFVEFIAAYTLLGYMIAEMRGRKLEPHWYTFGLVFIIAFGSATVIELIGAYPSILSINIPQIILITSTSLYGAVIYRLQLTEIQRL
jgi:glycopeptide antibiotics resistance protein